MIATFFRVELSSFPNPTVLGLALVALALVLVVPILFYGALAYRTWFEGKGRVRVEAFGLYDGLLAAGLVLLFSALTVGGFAAVDHEHSMALPGGAEILLALIANVGVELLFIAGIVGSLVWRGIPTQSLFGLNRIRVDTVFSKGVLALLLALPLIYGTAALSQLLLAGEGEAQELVRFLAQPGTAIIKVALAISAVFLAPPLEEFIFRGFVYGVLRRYAGPFAGLLVNAILFAGIHQNLQSFGALFVLATCLTLAYEWTGSLYVPITMHALSNLISVVSILSGHSDV